MTEHEQMMAELDALIEAERLAGEEMEQAWNEFQETGRELLETLTEIQAELN